MEIQELRKLFFEIDHQLISLGDSIEDKEVKRLISDFSDNELDFLEYKIERILDSSKGDSIC